MHNKLEITDASEVTLSLELDTSLSHVLDPGDPLFQRVHESLVQGLAEVMAILGIPGAAVVKITAPREIPLHVGRFLRLSVNGQLCRYADELLQRVHSYVNACPLDPEAKPTKLLAWLTELSKDSSASTHLMHEKLVEFLNLTCLEIIKSQPGILLGLDQVTAYIASLPDRDDIAIRQSEGWNIDPGWLLPMLRNVLNLKISIGDKQSVANVLKLAQGRSQADIVEDLIATLRLESVEIQIPQDYLRQITTFDQVNGPGMFTFLRTGLFQELGFRYPNFQFVELESLKPSSFAFKFNHLATLPLMGLMSHQCLVNETVNRLEAMSISSTATIHPSTGIEGSLIDVGFRDLAVRAGFTTWNQIEYLILCLATYLRENGSCFVHRQAVQDQLDQFQLMSPALVTAIESNVSLTHIIQVFRALAAEEIPVKNLRLILERFLEHVYKNPASDNREIMYRQHDTAHLNDAVDLLSFVRSGMKRHITQKYTRGTNTVVVYLLDQQIEKLFLDHPAPALSESEKRETSLDENQCDKIVEAIRAETAYLPPTVMVPTILTTADVRPSLHETLVRELPRMSVISYEELTPETNVQPIARITLNI